MKNLLIYIILSVTFFSCNKEDEQCTELNGHIEVIYCTPKNTVKCLPFEISNTPDGWEAHYGGNKIGIPLKPRLEINEEGDSLYHFDEYVDGKLTGVYEFSQNILDSYFVVSGWYKSIKNDLKIPFDALILRKEVVDNRWTDLEYVEKCDDYLKDYCEPTCDVMQDVRLFHNNAKSSLTYSKDAKIHTSDDHKINIYQRTYALQGGGVGGSSDYLTMIKYRGKNGDVVIDNGLSNIWSAVIDDYEFNFPYLTDIRLQQATVKGKTMYFVELSFEDLKPMHFDGNSTYAKRYAVFLFAHQIVNGKLMPMNVFYDHLYIAAIADKLDRPMHFIFDKDLTTLKIPFIDAKDYTFRGKYKDMAIKQ